MNLEQNTQRSLGGDDVSCSNFAVRTYALPDGAEREAMTAHLSITGINEFVLVGEGSTFAAGGKKYRVLSMSKDSMDFEPVEDATVDATPPPD